MKPFSLSRQAWTPRAHNLFTTRKLSIRTTRSELYPFDLLCRSQFNQYKSQADKERHEHWMEAHAGVKERATKATAVRKVSETSTSSSQKEDVFSNIAKH